MGRSIYDDGGYQNIIEVISPTQKPSTLGQCVFHLRLDSSHCHIIRYGAYQSRSVQWIANLERLGGLREDSYKFPADVLVDVNALR
jgi:hypothetical protein